jgi:hypothetical protein
MKTIAELEQEKDDLEIQIKVAKKVDKLYHENPLYMLANILHDMDCRHNHTDGCGWFYFDWEKLHPDGGLEYSRKEYLKKAKLYASMNFEVTVEDICQQMLKLNAVLRA